MAVLVLVIVVSFIPERVPLLFTCIECLGVQIIELIDQCEFCDREIKFFFQRKIEKTANTNVWSNLPH